LSAIFALKYLNHKIYKPRCALYWWCKGEQSDTNNHREM